MVGGWVGVGRGGEGRGGEGRGGEGESVCAPGNKSLSEVY